MEHILLHNQVIENTYIDKLHLLLDDRGKVIVLPILWTMHLANTQSVYGWHIRGEFKSDRTGIYGRKPKFVEKTFASKSVSENTIDNYVGHVFHFLEYINSLHQSEGTPSVHHTELINSQFLNHYLNNVLPERLRSSQSLSAHQAAISSYTNFLYYLEIKDILPTTIYRKTRQYMAEKDDRPKKLNYISHSERSSLLHSCNNQRDKLIIRMGYEVGLRAEENTGIVLDKHNAKTKSHHGLLTLFDELDRNQSKYSFEFVLNAKYTKGGRTRNIYFDRDLLMAMKHYYDTERNLIMRESAKTCDTLFVRADNEGKGLPINAAQASTLFRIVKRRCPHINQLLSFHDLRHSFATELYHSELLNIDGQETRSESAALIVVGERLGHVNTSSTKGYIRLRQQMLLIEGFY